MAVTRQPKTTDKEKGTNNSGKSGKKDVALKRPQAKPAAGKKDVVLKKEAGGGRIEGIKRYFRGVWSELKKVHWPTRREVVIYTGVVLVAVLIVSFLIWIFDSLLSKVLQLIII
ncbi:MAG: preprotein translocase subunit SecE [Bacillota bacterium]|jgi:preprotein translocase subunit SecE